MLAQKNKIPGDMDGLLSRYLIRERVKVVKPYLEDKRRILDIGCGLFRWQDLVPAGAEYIGIDFEKAIIKYNREHFHYKFLTVNAEMDDLSFLGNEFDLIIMLAVIEHFDKPEIVLRRLKSILSARGIIVLTTPHPTGTFLLNLGAKIRIFTQDKHQHHKLLDYNKIKSLASAAGYKVIRYERFLYGFNQLAILE